MKKNANKGFSLVELIIVIAIMAVLIGVLAPQFIKQVEKSRESTDLQNIDEVKTAVETFVADYAEHISATKITVTGTKGGAITCDATTDGLTGGEKTLTEYGIDGTTKMKSNKWTGNIVWEYSTSAYTWTLTSSTVDATYFKADGTAK
ncbi:MAG: type II secretion system protein [Lachnospiraceae bacterium]|nr:type II secretion system protein [Lachnospiraceae bacterium]